MSPKVSVILCAHQPRTDYLARTLASLRAQTLATTDWELVVVDNGSEPPLAASLDLGWHPRGRVLREERLGLAYGRAAGLEETTGDLVVFVDDDNLLATDYLAVTLEIADRWPMLGTWGARVTPLFEEQPPPDWVKPYLYHLAVTWCEEPVWSSFVSDRALPVGAGLCVRRVVADLYLDKTRHDPMHRRFGRTKHCAIAGDDQYICLCAESIGLGSGKFPRLRLEHLIPARRLVPASFLRVARGNAHGAMLLRAVWQKRQTYRDRWYFPLLKMCAYALLRRGMRRRIDLAEARGEFDALWEARRLRRSGEAGGNVGMDAAALFRP